MRRSTLRRSSDLMCCFPISCKSLKIGCTLQNSLRTKTNNSKAVLATVSGFQSPNEMRHEKVALLFLAAFREGQVVIDLTFCWNERYWICNIVVARRYGKCHEYHL